MTNYVTIARKFKKSPELMEWVNSPWSLAHHIRKFSGDLTEEEIELIRQEILK